jgi:hypothetical protein
MFTERRKHPRRRVLRRGKIVYRGGHSVLDCVLLDLSAGGARIRTATWLGLPDRFELRMDEGPTHKVEVRYRDLEVAGVRFLDDAA